MAAASELLSKLTQSVHGRHIKGESKTTQDLTFTSNTHNKRNSNSNNNIHNAPQRQSSLASFDEPSDSDRGSSSNDDYRHSHSHLMRSHTTTGTTAHRWPATTAHDRTRPIPGGDPAEIERPSISLADDTKLAPYSAPRHQEQQHNHHQHNHQHAPFSVKITQASSSSSSSAAPAGGGGARSPPDTADDDDARDARLNRFRLAQQNSHSEVYDSYGYGRRDSFGEPAGAAAQRHDKRRGSIDDDDLWDMSSTPRSQSRTVPVDVKGRSDNLKPLNESKAVTEPPEFRRITQEDMQSSRQQQQQPPQGMRQQSFESISHSNTPSIFQPSASLVAPVVAVDPAGSGKGLEVKAPVIADWDAVEHVELIHRQGLKAPPLVFELVEPSARSSATTRSYYQLFLPQQTIDQTETMLVCRRKRKQPKWRFSLDPSKMCKRGNPSYVAKMTSKTDPNQFLVTLANGVQVLQILIESQLGKHHVTVEILNQFLNVKETGKGGRVFTGLIQSYMQPMLSLKSSSSKRTVLEVVKPSDVTATRAPNPPELHINNKSLMEFDYPFTIFLSFAVACAVETFRAREALGSAASSAGNR